MDRELSKKLLLIVAFLVFFWAKIAK